MTQKQLFGIAKYPVALTILYLVLRQADWEAIRGYASSMPALLLVVAFLVFTLAQFASAARMNVYYKYLGKPLRFGYSIRLYYVGLFYNILLPGGIGGDAYKVYLLKKQKDYPVREGILIQLANRANGLLVLLLMVYAMLPFMDLPLPYPTIYAIMAALTIITIIGYIIALRTLLKSVAGAEWRALPYSMAAQLLNVICMLLLWSGIASDGYMAEFIFLFQVAAVAGMIPIAIGGLGIREFTFFYGAKWLAEQSGNPINSELGVVISLLMFAITVASALVGLLWLHRISKMNPCSEPK